MKKIFMVVMVLFSVIISGCGENPQAGAMPGGMVFVDDDQPHPVPGGEVKGGILGVETTLTVINTVTRESETISYTLGDPHTFAFESYTSYRITLSGPGLWADRTVGCFGPCPAVTYLSELDILLNYSGVYYSEEDVAELVNYVSDAFAFTAKMRPTWYTFPWDTYSHQATTGEYPVHRFMVGHDWESQLNLVAIFFNFETEGTVSIEKCRLDEVGVEGEEVRNIAISNTTGTIDLYVDYLVDTQSSRYFTVWCRITADPGAKLRLYLHGFEAEGDENRYFHGPVTEGPWINF